MTKKINIVVPEVLLQRYRNQQVFGSKSTATKSVNTSKLGTEIKGGKDNLPSVSDHVDDKQAAVLPSESKEPASFDEKASSELLADKNSGGVR